MRERARSPAAACAGQASPGRAPWRRWGKREGGKEVYPAAGATRERRRMVVVLCHLSFQLFLSVTFWTAPISGSSPPPGCPTFRPARLAQRDASAFRDRNASGVGSARSAPSSRASNLRAAAGAAAGRRRRTSPRLRRSSGRLWGSAAGRSLPQKDIAEAEDGSGPLSLRMVTGE